MSFEGYYRALCEDGHYSCGDVYAFDPNHEICHCGKNFIWQEVIDQTNGMEGVMQTKLRIISEAIVERCITCGTVIKTIELARYEPTNEKELIMKEDV
jgi:hypothetical protein